MLLISDRFINYINKLKRADLLIIYNYLKIEFIKSRAYIKLYSRSVYRLYIKLRRWQKNKYIIIIKISKSLRILYIKYIEFL